MIVYNSVGSRFHDHEHDPIGRAGLGFQARIVLHDEGDKNAL